MEGWEGDAGTAREPAGPPRPALSQPSPAQPGPPAELGLTSYFCCFIFSIRSNFSDSSWWIQSHSSWALSLAEQTGCQGLGAGHAPGSERLRVPSKATQRGSEFGIIGPIWLTFEAMGDSQWELKQRVFQSLLTLSPPTTEIHILLNDNEVMAKDPGPRVRKPWFKSQLFHSLIGDCDQGTSPRIVFPSQKKKESRNKTVKEMAACPPNNPYPCLP